ncbi:MULTISPECIES: hypothetical protein [Pseudomonadati]|uniref:hypothetical protein n=1 Tax=unclassified Halobacteriovorax TaxID=2639665 RepID=UPI000CD19FC1|nr:hypothetical protein [Halobacteriovorax sp. DA5]POB12981.1 hypothetical protein C0Z22_13995 [Halobacteriovorax sp. DA5]
MKIAILGSDKKALAAYRFFEDLGVHVKIIGQIPTDSQGEFREIAHRNVEVIRVHKRFLSPNSVLESRSRMADTFRVVFKVNATTEIERQKLENPEVFEKLGKDVLESLKNSIESFEDFDFICYSNELTIANPMGAAQVHALNELALADDERITYHNEHHASLEDIKATRNLCLVGTGIENLRLLSLIKEDYLNDLTKTLQLITAEEVPFGNLTSAQVKEYKDEISQFSDLLAKDRQQFDEEKREFEEKIMQWRSLEPHIKAKTPTPAEPKPRLMIYNSAVVSSVDKLLDRKGLFVTIEGSDLLGGAEQLKTLACDRICVDQGVSVESSKVRGLAMDEEGFYPLHAMTLDEIKENMLRYFSKQ